MRALADDNPPGQPSPSQSYSSAKQSCWERKQQPPPPTRALVLGGKRSHRTCQLDCQLLAQDLLANTEPRICFEIGWKSRSRLPRHQSATKCAEATPAASFSSSICCMNWGFRAVSDPPPSRAPPSATFCRFAASSAAASSPSRFLPTAEGVDLFPSANPCVHIRY